MTLTNMKLPKKNNSAMAEPVEMEREKYPYGLEISLNEESITKLGIEGLPDVGKKVMISARADVVLVRQSEEMNGKKNRRIEFQITDIEFEEEKEKKVASKELYG